MNRIGHCCFNFCNTAKGFRLGTFANLGFGLKIKLGPQRDPTRGKKKPGRLSGVAKMGMTDWKLDKPQRCKCKG